MRIVLDTSGLVSAIRSSNGAASEIVRLAVLGRLTLLMDYKLACEYRDVALRTHQLAAAGRTREDVEVVIDLLEAVATPVFVAFKYRPLSRDDNDDMVLDVANNGNANAVVTNNVRDFAAPADAFGIQTLTPRDFLISFRRGEPDNAG